MTTSGPGPLSRPRRVALFVTCLVDQFFPSVGEAALSVLERVGVRAEFPDAQTCCGQPFFNDGLRAEARRLASRFVDIFAPYDAVVTPSASCAAMVRECYESLFPNGAERARAAEFAAKTVELGEFLVRGLGVRDVGAVYRGRVALHPSCHALRGLATADCAETLLRRVRGLEWCELPQADVCCGFGGVFSVKFPAVSAVLADDKLAAISASGADTLVSTDVSCLMHLAGRMASRGRPVRTMHLAEVLAAGHER
jgi:L-lactate dehydrogenase complex protein LldE